MNIRAGMEYYNFPALELHREPERDRCYFNIPDMKTLMRLSRALGDAKFDFSSEFNNYREPVSRFAMEVTLYTHYVEIDYDYWNPYRGAAIAFMHMWECLWNKLRRCKTNPFAIRKGLLKKGWKVEEV